MDTFTNEEKFWATVNQWVRDGSNICDVHSFQTRDGFVTTVDLMGADGAREELVLEVTD